MAHKPTFKALPRPTLAALESGLKSWAQQVADRLRVEEAGRSAGGRPVLAAFVSDFDADETTRQHVLLTDTHTGSELNACTSLLHFLRWLISDDRAAAELRRRYLVAVIPCVDPDGYDQDPPINKPDPSPYFTAWTWDGPQNSAEADAVFAVMEGLQPEAHVDVHGLGQHEQMMTESTGIAWWTALSRSYEHELPRLMDQRAEEAGFLVTRGEQDAGQVRATHPVEGAEQYYYVSRAPLNPCCFSYRRYHSLSFTMEVGFDDSAVLRLRGLLEAGVRRWRYQWYEGLPVDNLASWGSTQLAAWGQTPQQRRASRLELWQDLPAYTYGCAYPEPRGTVAALAAFTPAAAEECLGPDQRPCLEDVISRLAARGGCNGEVMAEWATSTPAETFALIRATPQAVAQAPPRFGVAIRLLIPYQDARITHLALDGGTLRESTAEG